VAVRAVVEKLQQALRDDAELIERTILRAKEIDGAGDDEAHRQLANVERSLAKIGNKINDLTEMVGEGSEAERNDLKGALRAAMRERTMLQAEQARLRQAVSYSAASLTPEAVKQVLNDLEGLLIAGASGTLGGDAIHKAAELFRLLVGGRITVHVERRPGRKRVVATGIFTPQTLATAQKLINDPRPVSATRAEEVWVWLRKPPRQDLLTERVHIMMDVERLSYRAAAKKLQDEGVKINSGVVWQIYRRYYEMRGEPLPHIGYNNGHPKNDRRGTI
jgi:regulator of replication initiation timing